MDAATRPVARFALGAAGAAGTAFFATVLVFDLDDFEATVVTTGRFLDAETRPVACFALGAAGALVISFFAIVFVLIWTGDSATVRLLPKKERGMTIAWSHISATEAQTAGHTLILISPRFKIMLGQQLF